MTSSSVLFLAIIFEVRRETLIVLIAILVCYANNYLFWYYFETVHVCVIYVATVKMGTQLVEIKLQDVNTGLIYTTYVSLDEADRVETGE